MKIKRWEKIIFSDTFTIALIMSFILLCGIIQFPSVYAATSSGNTTVFDFGTNTILDNAGVLAFQCNTTGLSANLTIDIDPYAGTDEREEIIAYYRMSNGSAIQENITDTDFINRTRVVVGFNQTQFYNMTWVDADKAWKVLLSSNESEDITLYLMANSKSYECKNATATIKIRPAFYFTLRFYKGSNMTSGVDASPYKNEFQYVYMRFYNDSTSWTDSTIFRDMSYLDRMFRWLPFYEDSFTATSDDVLSFWAHYNNGEARIKLYEAPQNYSIYLMTDDTYGMTWTDEFTRPQLQDFSWKSEAIPKLRVTTGEDTTLRIYLSRWEAQKFLFLMNMGYYAIVFIGWIIIMMVAGSHMGWKAMIGVTIGYMTLMRLIGIVVF